jgi:excisionase family DNA binding protein
MSAPRIAPDDSLALLTATEAAELLRVTPSWIRVAARDGRLPCLRLGAPDGPLRFARSKLLAHIEAARSAWEPGQRPGTALKLVSGSR